MLTRTFLFTFTVFLFLPFLPPCSRAQEGGGDPAVFQVSDVAVDVKADSAAHAREQAIMQAQRGALNQLLSRLGADAALEQKLGDEAVAALVQAFEVQQEKLSSVRYIGVFTVRFKPAAVRGLLGKHGVSYSEARSRPVVVLPVVSDGGRSVLWEDRTSWRAAWENVAGKGGLVPVVVPGGDLDDIAIISAQEAIAGKAEALSALAGKYGTDGVVVAVLNADPAVPGPEQNIRIDVFHYDASGTPYGGPEHVSLPAADGSKAVAAAIEEGVRQIRNGMESKWREMAKATAAAGPLAGQTAHLRVTVPINGLSGWHAMKGRITSAAGVKHLNVISLAREAASIELEFYGDIPQLQAAMKAHNLSLDQVPDTGAWILRESGATESLPDYVR